MIKKIKKRAKRGLIFAQGHVDATWHSWPRGSATRAHAAPTRHGCDVLFIFIVIIRVIVHISIPYSEFKLTLHIVAPYKPESSL